MERIFPNVNSQYIISQNVNSQYIISQNDPTLELVLDNNLVVHLLNHQTALSSTFTLTLYSYGLCIFGDTRSNCIN